MIKWIKDRLAPEASQWWKLWSIRLNSAGLFLLSWIWFDPISILAVWNMMPAVVHTIFPPNALVGLGLILFVLSMLARLVKQPKVME